MLAVDINGGNKTVAWSKQILSHKISVVGQDFNTGMYVLETEEFIK